MKKNKILISGITIFSLASFVLAKDFAGVVSGFTNGILKTITGLAFVFMTLFFVYRLFIFMKNLADSPESKEVEEGKKWIIFAILVFFVAVSIFGIVKLVKNSLKLNDENNATQLQLHITH